MERWVLDGDSYSFLRSAPRVFNLPNREVPNRVEIFDITTIPSHRSAISETTCLCDIFGDDCESPSLSSSPASATFLRKDVDQPFPTDDANDSSGSYHTASGSDLGDSSEVTYDTPSPKNVNDFSTCDTKESSSPSVESTILTDSKNGLNPHCTPPKTPKKNDDISQDAQDFNSTSDTSLITSAEERLGETEPALHEQSEITTPEHTSTSSCLDNVDSSENTESINYNCIQQEDFILAKQMVNSRSSSELSNPSSADNTSDPIHKISTSEKSEISPAIRDINDIHVPSVTPELRPTSSTSHINREISSTPVSSGKSSPDPMNLCSAQAENISEFSDLKDTYCTSPVSMYLTNDSKETDSLDVYSVSIETREPVCSTNVIEKPASPEVNENCSSPDVQAPGSVIIYSPLGYTISPSPINDRIIYSMETEALSSTSVMTETGHNEICSSPDHSVPTHSPEPVTSGLSQSCSNNTSPINDTEVYSAEPEASPSSPVVMGIDFCSSPDYSVPTHSPEPVTSGLSQSPDNTSPITDTEVFSAEPEALPSSPVVMGIDYCSSPDYSVPTHSPEPVVVGLSQSCSNNSPPITDTEVYSAEPEASPSSPVVDYCSSPDYSVPTHSPEPVIIGLSQSCSNNSPPINDKEVYSPEPEASPSSPVVHYCSSPDYSIPTHSPEPVISQSPMGYTISPSPINEKNVYSTEHDGLSPSSAIIENVYPATPIYSGDFTPELRSITSTPDSGQNYHTLEPTSPAPSLELSSNTYSPEIRTTYSTLPQNTKSAVTGGLTYSAALPTEVLTQSPEVEKTVCGNYSKTSNTISDVFEASVSPTSNKFLSTTESRSRPSSSASDHTRDSELFTAVQPILKTFIPFEEAEDKPLPLNSEGMNHPSPSLTESGHYDDLPHTETFECTTSVLDECRDTGPQVVSQIQIFQDPSSKPTSLSPVVQMEQWNGTNGSPVIVIDDTTDSKMESVKVKQCQLEAFNGNNETAMLKNDTASSDEKLGQVPMALSKSPGTICSYSGGEYDKQTCREKQESGKREGEGVELMEESSYRGEQVELSFNARNRKEPACHSPALSSRDPKSGPPARCYFESHPSTLQQQSHLKALGSQQENKGGARRVQSAAQGKYSSAGFLPSETSSMGSEFDEADNEVKWFTDLAFRSLSSPQVDYLDVHNSSYRSSTNVSQQSTNVDSLGAVAWMTYADLRGSTLHENDDLLHSSSLVPHDGLDPTKRFEMGSFECVDVALETKEESSRKKRTVPKRQIQLLRRNTDESKPTANTEKVLDSTHVHSKDTCVCQHSTPASREEPDSPQTDRKRSLQKSLSLDDASPKTQMASCIIKSVLSKKMEDAQKETFGNTDHTGDISKNPGFSPSSFDGVQSNIETRSIISSQHSESTLLSEGFATKEKRSPQLKKCAPKVPPKPIFRPTFINTGDAELIRDERRPKVANPFDDKVPVKQNNNKKEGGGGEQNNSDSANVKSTSAAVATQTVTMQSRMTSRTREQQMTHENQEQHGCKSVFMSKTSEITLKPSITKEKKKSSLKVSLSPDLERSKEMCEHQSMDKAEEDIKVEVTETKEENVNKTSVIHKVRDVRKLVKNTYNLSFKASNSVSIVEDATVQETREKPPQTPPALHIECKAISWKDKQASASKEIHWQGETQAVDTSKISQARLAAETSKDTDITEITSKVSLPKILSKELEQKATASKCTSFCEPVKTTERCFHQGDQNTTQRMPPRPTSKDREVSAFKVLQDDALKTNQNTSDSTITDSSQIKSTSSSHSVSMLLKEKGMQADIGVCEVISVDASATAKHVNRLEIPLQACLSEAQELANSSLRTSQSHDGLQFRPKKQSVSPKQILTEEPSVQQTQGQEKSKITATTTMTQIPTNLTTSDKTEVRSVSSHIKTNAMPTTASKEIELPIQVRSISSDRLKPFVPPKPSYKQSFAEIKSMSSDRTKPDPQTTSLIKQQAKLTSEPKKNDTPATLIQKDQLNEVSSNNTKKLSVSAVSSYKPPLIPVTTTPSSVQKSTRTFASVDQHQSSAFLQTSSTSQTTSSQEQSMAASSNPSIKPTVSQAYNHTQPGTRAPSNNRFHTQDYRLYASDDPPSYDERESFSPLHLSDLPPQRFGRYHSTTKQSVCSCTQTSHSHQSHPHHSPQGQTPPASESPGQVLSCPGAPPQAQVRPHQCRPDGQALSFLPALSNTTNPPASALIQPLHHQRTCPAPNIQSYSDNQPPASGLHSERRPANHHSPQPVGPASYHDYAHPANMPGLDPRPQMFNPQDLPPSFSHDYGNEGPGGASVLYPENTSGISCGQAPRRVLLDPDTGKYFYVEVPMQPLRKMLFDPELGQYVEVLIPQQAMSHSGLYPPSAPPYSSLHNPGLYTPQYLPYAVPSYPTIPNSAQQVRHPEAPPIPTTLHQPSLRYGSPTSQVPKNEPKGHSSLNQNYLESMYYIPTGINASPNSTPSDCYHKPSSSMPPSGGRRV